MDSDCHPCANFASNFHPSKSFGGDASINFLIFFCQSSTRSIVGIFPFLFYTIAEMEESSSSIHVLRIRKWSSQSSSWGILLPTTNHLHVSEFCKPIRSNQKSIMRRCASNDSTNMNFTVPWRPPSHQDLALTSFKESRCQTIVSSSCPQRKVSELLIQNTHSRYFIHWYCLLCCHLLIPTSHRSRLTWLTCVENDHNNTRSSL